MSLYEIRYYCDYDDRYVVIATCATSDYVYATKQLGRHRPGQRVR